MPESGLESWVLALNQAVAQGLRFGTDVVFTFGPYATVYTRNYHPATDGLMIFGSLYLALCFSLAIAVLMEKTLHRWVIVLCAILAGIPLQPRRNLLSVSTTCFSNCIQINAPREPHEETLEYPNTVTYT